MICCMFCTCGSCSNFDEINSWPNYDVLFWIPQALHLLYFVINFFEVWVITTGLLYLLSKYVFRSPLHGHLELHSYTTNFISGVLNDFGYLISLWKLVHMLKTTVLTVINAFVYKTDLKKNMNEEFSKVLQQSWFI